MHPGVGRGLPDAAEAERLAGRYAAAGDTAAATKCLADYLERYPGHYRLRCLLGLVHQQAGEFESARLAYEAALAVAPPSLELFHNLGLVHVALDDPARAQDCFEKALQIDPEALPTLDELAALRVRSGDLLGAAGLYERILRKNPRHVRAHVGMAEVFSDHGWEDDARRCFETALAIDPGSLEALNGLGILCKRRGQLDLALHYYDRALAQCPAQPAILRNKALLHGACGDHAAAERYFRQALDLDPDDPDTHFSLGCDYLMAGRLPEGWREYEYRWTSRERGRGVRRPESGLPRWSGEPVDKDGSALVIYTEQGFGDAIQFARYAELAAARFARVRLQTRKPLQALFERSFAPFAEVVVDVADERGFTHHCPLLSLPLAFATALDTIPARIPYLQPDPAAVEAWRCCLAAAAPLKVGVVWGTGKRGDHKRSFELPPAALAPLFGLPGITWVSLNKEALQSAEQAMLRQHGVLDWMGEIADFDATAALVSALDLVVSVDTAVAHLAGALGKPVWLLNRFESEWRWLRDRADSPWYPSMRIFRQPASGDWDAVVAAVGAALASVRS